MLEVDVTNCIRDSNEAELPPRDRDVLAALQASARRLAARGLAGSGNALHERARIGCDELTVRAEIIWRQIQRCHVAFSGVYDDHLGVDLSEQIAERVTAQAAVVLGMVDSGPSLHVPERAKTFVRDAVATRRDELIKKLHSEVRFFVQAALRAPNARPGAITIHGNVGAVQTGAYAQAHINIDAAGSAHLVESLEQLRAALPQTAEMSDDQRAESIELVNDLIVTAGAPRPNGSKIAGLLNGLAITIQTIASARGAWDLVRDAARAMGIPVP